MRILRATAGNIRKAAKIVGQGGLVIYPTDTVYGLGCDPFSPKAVERIFEMKGEREDKPLPILGSSIENLQKIAYITERVRRIVENFWPGPLTLVVRKKSALPDAVTCGLDSVGVRIPNHKLALQLIGLCNGLLVGTSANKTGCKPPTTAREASEKLGANVDVILDAGRTPLSQESTVVDLTSKAPKILREGPIKLQEVFSLINS